MTSYTRTSRDQVLIQERLGALGSVATFKPGSTGTLSGMNIDSLSLLDKTVQVIPDVLQIMSRLLERKMTSDDTKPSRCQHK